MTFNPSGGVQRVRLPFKPPVALGQEMVVRLLNVADVDVYAVLVRVSMERRHGEWLIWAYVRPIPTAEVLSGFGEYSTDVRDLEVIV